MRAVGMPRAWAGMMWWAVASWWMRGQKRRIQAVYQACHWLVVSLDGLAMLAVVVVEEDGWRWKVGSEVVCIYRKGWVLVRRSRACSDCMGIGVVTGRMKEKGCSDITQGVALPVLVTVKWQRCKVGREFSKMEHLCL